MAYVPYRDNDDAAKHGAVDDQPHADDYSDKATYYSTSSTEEAMAYPQQQTRAKFSSSLPARLLNSPIVWRVRSALDTRTWSQSKRRRAMAIIITGFSVLIIGLLWNIFGPTRRRLHSITHRLPRKAVVAASWTDVRDAEWIEEFPNDWEIFRYIMNDQHAQYHPPINYAREPMAYLTFIIDHYHDLPDYTVFIHGHNWSWHQPEPMIWKLESLNLTALDEDKYISLHCLHQPTCNLTHPKLDLTADFHKIDKAGKILPWFWQYVNMPEPLPDKFSWPSGAQFAVSKEAILSRSLDFWIRYRKPMLQPLPMMDHEYGKGYYWGLIHERMWHVVFGKPSVYCPDQTYCTEVQWSNGVLCDRYPVPPLGHEPIMTLDKAIKETHCFKNNNGTKNWVLKPFSLCNMTEYLELPDNRCPWDEWATP